MSNPAFERAAQNELLAQVLFELIRIHGGSITLPAEFLFKQEDMGGVVIVTDAEKRTITVSAINPEEAEAFKQSMHEEKQ